MTKKQNNICKRCKTEQSLEPLSKRDLCTECEIELNKKAYDDKNKIWKKKK